MTTYDVIVEKVIDIDQNSRSQTAMESVSSVSKLSAESVGSRRELRILFTPPTSARLNSTVASRLWVCIGLYVSHIPSLSLPGGIAIGGVCWLIGSMVGSLVR